MNPMMIGMLGGLGKSMLIDAPQANRERALAATTASLSPWTGMTPTMPQEANPLGSMMQGGLAGAQYAQANPAQAAAPAAPAPEAIPGTIIPKSEDAQRAFFQAEQKKKMQAQMMGKPGSEYFNLA